ncbi:MAG TPA: hypothetical protein VLG37_01465 [Candidatus Saccharimonadales bacterium]|nr:hypothetical protein [Candidatus Saccharimonadales bacterium]
MGTLIDQEVEVTSVYFWRKPNQPGLETYPKRMVYGDREYNFMESGIRYLVRKGTSLTKLFDMSDGNNTYRLRQDDGRWTLVGMKAGA